MRTVRCSSRLLVGGCLAWGVFACQGVSACQGGLPAGDVSACQGVYTSPCGQTDTCENITIPKLLLRTMINLNYSD